jgi:hypothetical protein
VTGQLAQQYRRDGGKRDINQTGRQQTHVLLLFT